MDSEKLARMVRIAIGEHNDESEPVVALAKKMADEIARLRAEAEALRVDAERYRWLRHADMDGVCVVDVNVWLDFDIADCEQIDGEKLDAAIDAARGGE